MKNIKALLFAINLFVFVQISLSQSVTSIDRFTPSNEATNAISVIYRVTFSENVNGVTIGAFSITPTGTASGTVFSVSSSSGTIIDVTVNGVGGNGTIRLDLSTTTGITDDDTNPLTGTYSGGQAYTIDNDAPTASITYNPVGGSYKQGTNNLVITATFSEDMALSPLPKISMAGVETVSPTDMARTSATVYTFTYSVPAGNDVQTITIGTGTDLAGNVITAAPGNNTFTVDNTAPAIPTVSGTTPTNDQTPTWTWTHDAAGGAGFYRYGYVDGTWDATDVVATSFTPGSNLSAGNYTLYVQERDAVGNWSTSGSHLINVDLTAPTAPTVGTAGTTSTPTNDQTPTWYWTAGGGGNGTFRYKIDDSDLSSGATTTTSLNYTSGTLGDGDHTLYVQERDAAGNWSTSGSHLINIDATPPTPPTVGTAGTTSTPTNDQTPTWYWTAGGGGNGTFRYKLDNSDLSAGATETTDLFYTSGTLGDGNHTLYVQERDAAGNWSTSGSHLINIDATPPTPPTVGTAGTTSTPTNDQTPTWYWTAGGGGNGTFRYKLDNSDLSAGATETTDLFYTSGTLGAGDHTLYVQERDVLGNWSTSGSHLINIDLTAPTAPTVGTAGTTSTPTNDQTPTWYWTAGGGGNGTFRYKLDNSDLSAGATETTSLNYTSGTLGDGDHTLYVQERDAAGNWSTSGSHLINIDATPPTPPTVGTAGTTLTPTNDQTPTWYWTAGGGGNGTFRYKIDDSDLSSGATTTTSLNYTSGTLGAGNHTLYVQERDAVGNWSTNGSYVINIDIITQTPTLTSPASNTAASINFNATFSLPEAALGGTVKMIFDCTNDGDIVNRIVTFKSNFESSGVHSTILNGTDLTSCTDVLSVVTSPTGYEPKLWDGKIYTVYLEYQDVLGNTVASVNNTNFFYEQDSPTATISPVASPRNSNAGIVPITFSRGVRVSSVGINDFTLTKDGSTVDISGCTLAYSGEWISYSGYTVAQNFSVNLSSVTTTEGTYVFTIKGGPTSDIRTSGGSLFVTDASTSWVTDVTPPTADIVDITPDPRNNSVGTVTINFLESVTGVDISDFTLTRGGSSVDISGLSVGGSDLNYTLDLSTVTGTTGAYVLTVIGGAGIKDLAGNNLAGNATDSWNTDATPPTLTSVGIRSNNSKPATAKVGNTVYVDFTADEDIQTPTVIIDGTAATSYTGGPRIWTASRVMALSDAEGIIPFNITFKDLLNNSGTDVSTVTNGSSVDFSSSLPQLTSVSIASDNISPYSSSRAKVGSWVTLTFTSDKKLDGPSVISLIAGHSATVTNPSGDKKNWLANYQMVAGDIEGTIPFTINFQDEPGNIGLTVSSTTNSSSVIFDKTLPELNAVSIASNNTHTNYVGSTGQVTLTITGSEDIVITNSYISKIATVLQPTSTPVQGSTAKNWTASYSMTGSEEIGVLPLRIEYKDLAGNTGTIVTSTTNSSTVTYDNVKPTLKTSPAIHIVSNNSTNTAYAKVGDVVTLTFTSNESIENVIVTINERNATVSNISNDYTAVYTMSTLDLVGRVLPITIDFKDYAGNLGLQVTNTSDGSLVTYDFSAPLAPSTPDLDAGSDSNTNTDNITSTTTPMFTGTAEANSNVKLYCNSVQVGSTTASAGGSWSITSSVLTEGVKFFTATATDGAGNVSAVSASLSVTIDVTNPDSPSIPDLDVDSDSGTSNTDNYTNDNTPTFKGTAEPNSTVTIYIDGNPGVSVITNSFGLWTATESTLATGTYTITSRAKDAAGNVSVASSGLSITIDGSLPSAPSAPNLSPGSDSGTFDTDNNTKVTTPEFTGTAESGAIVKLYADGVEVGSTTAVGVNWTITSNVLTGGVKSMTAKAIDAAGNISLASVALPITIDISSPAQPGTPDLDATSDSGTLDTDNITNDNTPKFNGTAEADAIIKLYSNSVEVGTAIATGGNWTITTSVLTDGVKSITVTATDAAGNVSVLSNALTVTIDITAPSAPGTPDLDAGSDTGTSNSDNYTSDNTPTFSGTAESNAVITIYSGATSVGTTTANVFGLWTVTTSTLTEGSNSITVKATDAAGNTSVASSALVIILDITAPAIPNAPDLDSGSDSGVSTDDYTIDNTPTFIGTAEADAIVKLYSGATEVGSGIATGGNWTITSIALADGVKSMTVKAIDAAGNVSAASTALSITIDTNSPSKPGSPDLDASSDLGASNTDNLTNDNTPTFSGTAEANSLVKLYSNGSEVGSITATAGGTWSITSIALTDGTKSMAITATDFAGNTSITSDFLSITVDTQAPIISSSTVPTGVYKVGSTIVLSILADDKAYTGQTVSVNGNAQTLINNNNNSFTVNYQVQENDNEHNAIASLPIILEFKDLAGNVNTAVTSATVSGGTLTLDSKTPQITSVTSDATASGILKIGDQIVFTLTPAIAETGLIVAPTTYNSKPIVWTTSNGGTTYTAIYSVQAGDNNQETPLQIGNVTLADAAGNISNPFSYTSIGKQIYGLKPTVAITGTTTRCDYPTPTVPITFTFTGKKPYDLTYNDGTSDQFVSGINADSYIINVLKGTYTLVSLVDATGNTNNTAISNATVTVNALPTIQFTSSSITVNKNDAAVNLMSYVQTGTGGSFTGEGVTTTNYFYPSLVEAKPTIPYQLTYTLTNSNGCTSTKTFSVTVTSDLGYISGLNVNYCKNNWSPTSVIAVVNNVTNYAGLSPTFTLEPASNKTSTVDWNHFSINPREMKAGTYILKYAYVEQSTGSNREIQYSFDIDSVGKDIDFKVVDNTGTYTELSSEYCKNSTDVLLEVINNYPKGGLGYFTGPTSGFNTDDKSFKATFRPSSAPLNQQLEIAFYFVTDASSPRVGCSSDTVRKVVTIHSLTPISFDLKDNYNYEEKPIVLNGTPIGGVFSSPDNVIINSTTISPSLTTNFNTNNPVNITYTYTDGNQCTSTLTKTTKIYKADAQIENLNSLYCYEDKILDISCSPIVNSVTYSGVFSSSKGAITQSVSPGTTAKYSIKDVGDGQDTVRFTYYVGPISNPTEYTITKLVYVDNIGEVSMVVDTKYCSNIEKVDINVNHRPMKGENSFTYDGNASAFSSNPLFATLSPSKETTFGDHVITCTFTSDKGCISSDTKIVAINPVATFPATPFVLGEACPGTTKPVQFINKTIIPVGATMSWSWNIEGKANVSTEKNPEWQFTSTGSKAVYLEATTEKGCVSRTPTDYINVGISAKADFTWNNECLDGTSVQFTDNSTGGIVDRSRWIFNNDTIGYNKDLTYSFNELGRYDLKLAIQTKDRCVDTIVKQIVIQPYIKFQELPNMVYSQNFDSNNEFYNWASRGISDAYKTTKWELGTPDETRIKQAASGSNAWFTKLISKTDIENSQVVSPCFDFTGLSKPMIKMNVWSYSEPKRDGAVLQYSIDKGQTWIKLGTKGEGINWFNSDNILTNPGQQPTTEEPEGWSQVPMNEWTNVRHNLDSLIGKTNVRFRIAYSKDATNSEKVDGFAFDDIWIGERQQIVLGEYFTNVDNTLLNDFMRKYENKESVDFIPIHYHTGDAIFDDYSAGPSSRLFYYGSLQNPYIISNGTEASSLADTVSFKNTNDVQSLYDPKVGINLSISSTNIGVSLKALKDLSGEELVLFTAIVKKSVDKNGSTYYNVIRRFLPSPGGILLSTSGWIKDMEQLHWISVNSSDFAEYLNSRLVVFVQNAKTKEVYQVVSSDLSNVTDIKPIDVGKLVDIYPNPATSNLIIECEYQIERLIVLDITGRIVGEFNPKQQQFSLPVNSLKGGLYILKGTTTNRGEFIKKFIKQ